MHNLAVTTVFIFGLTVVWFGASKYHSYSICIGVINCFQVFSVKTNKDYLISINDPTDSAQ